MFKSEAELISDLLAAVPTIWGDQATSHPEIRCHDQARMDILVSTPTVLIAVEAKMSHWHRLITQAFLHRYCVDQIYIAIPADKLHDSIVVEAARFDIGVISVDNGSTRIVQGAGMNRPSKHIRRRILESRVRHDDSDVTI